MTSTPVTDGVVNPHTFASRSATPAASVQPFSTEWFRRGDLRCSCGAGTRAC